LIQRLNLQQNVFIINKNNLFLKKNHKDVKVELMQEAWGIILPSVKEGWGMVVTEAAACGTPAIVSNVTGLRDAVIGNKTGMVLSRNPKPKELAKAMKLMIMDSDFRKKLSLGAIERSKNFTWEKSYKAFKRLIAV
jgi:glycosyltransferase involved in cell wall biosynthesis